MAPGDAVPRVLPLLLLAACAQPAPPASPPTTQQAQNAWRSGADREGGSAWAAYGPNERDDLFRVFCNTIVDRVTLQIAQALPDGQRMTMTIHTRTRAIALSARSENIPAGPLIYAQIEGADPRLTALGEAQEQITVEIAGRSTTVPWNDAIAATLAACR